MLGIFLSSFLLKQVPLSAIWPQDIDDATGDRRKKERSSFSLLLVNHTLFLEDCANFKMLIYDAKK